MRHLAFVGLSAIMVGSGCVRGEDSAAAATKATTTSPQTMVKVAKIVFIDKENACECTRQRTADTWTALQSALGMPARLPIERFHVDTQTPQTEAYTTARQLLVIPGIYFVDERNTVLDMLQGEVTAEQVTLALKGR